MDCESPNKFIETDTKVINREKNIVMAGDNTRHFRFICSKAFSLKVFIKCQHMFDILSSFQHVMKIFVSIKLIYYLIHWRGHSRNLLESRDGCSKLFTFNLGDEVIIRLEEKSSTTRGV